MEPPAQGQFNFGEDYRVGLLVQLFEASLQMTAEQQPSEEVLDELSRFVVGYLNYWYDLFNRDDSDQQYKLVQPYRGVFISSLRMGSAIQERISRERKYYSKINMIVDIQTHNENRIKRAVRFYSQTEIEFKPAVEALLGIYKKYSSDLGMMAQSALDKTFKEDISERHQQKFGHCTDWEKYKNYRERKIRRKNSGDVRRLAIGSRPGDGSPTLQGGQQDDEVLFDLLASGKDLKGVEKITHSRRRQRDFNRYSIVDLIEKCRVAPTPKNITSSEMSILLLHALNQGVTLIIGDDGNEVGNTEEETFGFGDLEEGGNETDIEEGQESDNENGDLTEDVLTPPSPVYPDGFGTPPPIKQPIAESQVFIPPAIVDQPSVDESDNPKAVDVPGEDDMHRPDNNDDGRAAVTSDVDKTDPFENVPPAPVQVNKAIAATLRDQDPEAIAPPTTTTVEEFPDAVSRPDGSLPEADTTDDGYIDVDPADNPTETNSSKPGGDVLTPSSPTNPEIESEVTTDKDNADVTTPSLSPTVTVTPTLPKPQSQSSSQGLTTVHQAIKDAATSLFASDREKWHNSSNPHPDYANRGSFDEPTKIAGEERSVMNCLLKYFSGKDMAGKSAPSYLGGDGYKSSAANMRAMVEFAEKLGCDMDGLKDSAQDVKGLNDRSLRDKADRAVDLVKVKLSEMGVGDLGSGLKTIAAMTEYRKPTGIVRDANANGVVDRGVLVANV